MIQAIAKRVAGLDVHQVMVMATLLYEDNQGEIKKETREYKTFPNDLKRLAIWLKQAEVELIVMESTGIYWKTVYEAMEDEELKSYVVNARFIKNVPGRKTDIMDSEWLAELGRCGLLRPSFIPPRDIRELRLLTRYRMKLMSIYGCEKNRLTKVLEASGIKLGCIVSDIDGVSARRMVEAILEGKEPKDIAKLAIGKLKRKEQELIQALENYRLSGPSRFVLNEILSHIKWLEIRLDQIDEEVVSAMKPYEVEWQLLQTIPGINRISAAMLVSEIGVDMSCFKSKEHLSSWAGMCPGNNESAGKKKSGKTRKGNKYIGSLLCECANSTRNTTSQFKGMYQGLVIRRGHKRAIVALGHKLLEIIYVILKNKKPYKDPIVNYEEMAVKKNAPRWIQTLKKYGYISEAGIKQNVN
ncbi:MAG: IS110 family transposase [Desulfobacterales bacterium]|nr:IS110 family transposase [Desulfobacterales bacterium]